MYVAGCRSDQSVFLSYDNCGDGISDRVSLNCHMDLDSLWMVHREDRRTVETRSHAEVSVWRGVLCGFAHMSCLPEFPVTNGLKDLNDLGRNCIMDLSACGTLSPVEGLERDCAEVGEESITVHGGWSGPDVSRTPAMVAMVEMDALPMGNGTPLDCAVGCPAWDGGHRREMVDDVTICCGDDWCDSAFPSGSDDPLPVVVCNDKLFSDDVLAVREEVPVLTIQILMNKGVPLVTPLGDQDLRRIQDELFSQDDRTDGVSRLSLAIRGLLIRHGAVGLDGHDRDHWRPLPWLLWWKWTTLPPPPPA